MASRGVPSCALISCVLVLMARPPATAGAQDQPAGQTLRNAIFNGDFQEGRAGWAIGGPRDLRVETHRTMVEHRSDAELVLSHADLEQSLTLYSPYPIKVNPGEEHVLTLTARGTGEIAFGAYEYADRDRNTIFPLSERLTLTPESQTWSFTYVASDEAVTIRPRIVIYGREDGTGGAFELHLIDFRLMLPQDEFEQRTTWPEWALSGAFSDYTGLSAEEMRRIAEAVRVQRVLPPYQPVRQAGASAFALTTSRFDFGGAVLPRSIEILGEPVLAGPMRLDLRTSDGRSLTLGRAPVSYRADEQRAVARQMLSGDGWTLDLTGTLEYDALLILDAELRTEKAIELTEGSLTIPLTREVARLIRYNNDFPDGSYCFGEGPIPEPGESVEVRHTIGRAQVRNDWRPRVLPGPRGALWEWRRGVPRYFWVGDEERGLGLVTESDEGWNIDEGDLTWVLERTPKSLVARLYFITRPLTVDGSWRIRLIMQALPPKPVRPDWFRLRFNRFWNWEPGDTRMIERIEQARVGNPPVLAEAPPPHVLYAQAGDGEGEMRPPWASTRGLRPRDIGILNWQVWSVGCGSPQVSRPNMMRRYLEAGVYAGHMALPYLAPTHLSVHDLNGFYYAAKTDAWARFPSAATSYYVKICPNSFASEYQAYEIGRLIDEYGIEGIYFDNTHPEPCANLEHGCGWADSDGNVHPTTPVLGMRRLFMMVREQFLKRGREPFIWKHAGAFPGEISFVDAQLDGEGTYGYDHTQMFTTAEFRARFIGPNQFGLVEVYLPQFSVGTDTSEVSGAQQVIRGTRPLMALALIHGTPIYCGAINSPTMFKAWAVLDELREPTVDFIPYWHWPVNEALNAREIYASLYRQSANSVLVVSNLSASDAAVEIPRAELDRLIPNLERAEDHMDGWPAKLDAEALRLNVPAKNFRLISLH
ncbi:MAG: hypothetical protein AB7Y46_18600 [Armatimonadota bacterium]